MTTDGPVQLDFVNWASDKSRSHPIAKNFQALQKNVKDRQRWEQPMKSPVKGQEKVTEQTIKVK